MTIPILLFTFWATMVMLKANSLPCVQGLWGGYGGQYVVLGIELGSAV